MNLEDLVDENGLQQDDWSLPMRHFGDEGQLEVVGWSGRRKSQKFYITRCTTCAEDYELFGGGYFRSTKGDLNKGAIPCGCAFSPRWSKEQYRILCSRKAIELGYEFVDFTGDWKGVSTKIKLCCKKHGDWSSSYIHVLINGGRGCPLCGQETASMSLTKDDGTMIESFFASGAFHPDTKFWRSGRKNKVGRRSYWFMSCPRCGETEEAYSGSLQKGSMPCGCSVQRQKECYVNMVRDDENVIAIKFGISNNSNQRLKMQNARSVYKIEKHSIYRFPDVASCKKAERECLQTLECGVVLKRDFSDGYTETTWIYNLDKIVEIYERNGGVLKPNANNSSA